MAELVLVFDNIPGTLVAKQVGTAHIADAAIVSAKIGAGIVGTPHLANGAVLSGKIGSGQIGTPHIAAGGILSAHVGANVLANPHLANQGMLSSAIGANVLANPHIQNQGILSSALGLQAVGLPHLVRGPTSGQVLTAQGTTADLAFAAAAGAKIASGTYTGNGATTRQITTGFLCKLVIIIYFQRTWVLVPSATSYHYTSSPYHYDDVANCYLHASDGFVVGTSGGSLSNQNAYVFYYVALG